MKILSVDDNPQNRQLIERALKDHFDVISDDGSSNILDLMNEHQPDIVLMDIMLEDKSGYDLCTEIRQDDTLDAVVLVFVSALDSSDDKLKAYGVGGDDYICKPVDLSELKEKMLKLQKRVELNKNLVEQANFATSAAFTSMQQAGELGEVIQFFSDSVQLYTPDALYARLKQFFSHFGLNMCVEFRLNNDTFCFPKDSITQLEIEILEMGRGAERIIPFGKNILFNANKCSILVKNLPLDDIDLTGRLRDNFAILLTASESRVTFFESEMARKVERKKASENLKKLIIEDFQDVKNVANQQEQKLEHYIDKMSENLEARFFTLGLDESQESDVRSFIDDIKDEMRASLDLSFVIDEKIGHIHQALQNHME